MIPYASHVVEQDDIDAVTAVLRSPRLTQGETVPAFEAALCQYTGARFAVVVANGTLALWAAYRAWIPPVFMPAITFAATANAAQDPSNVCLRDVDPETWCGRAKEVEVQVTLGGYPAPVHEDMIVDAAHGPWKKGPELMRTFSFHPAKGFTSGEGGAIVTDDPDVARRLRQLRDNGRAEPGEACEVPGLNLRLSDIHAALGLSQLRKLDRWQARRRKIADYYRAAFAGLPIRMQPDHPDHALHLLIVCVDREDMSRDTVRQRLAERGVGTQVHYQPLYRLAPYRQDPSRFPNSEWYAARALSLPMSHALTDAEVEHVAKVVREVLG